uniref:CCHC-type domain-containing protein n=1 Tax=Fagus sylvatica TaxID=28930 RepID=A0A2N9EW08_FAGSY
MATNSGDTLFTHTTNHVPIFNGEHYDYWSSQMMTIFISQDLWDLIEDGFQEPPATGNSSWTDANQKEYKENLKKNATALRIIHQGVSKSIYPRIFGEKKAKDAWETLQKEFQGSKKVISVKLQNLWRDFDNLAMKETESVKDFHSRVAEIVNQIKSYGDTIQEKKLVEKILRSLPQKFDHVVAAIEESKDLSILSLYELMGSLEAHEGRMSRFSSQPLEQAFQSKVNVSQKEFSKDEQEKRGGNYQKKGQYGRGRGNFKDGLNKGRGRTGEKYQQKPGTSSSQCFICKKPGHESKECRFRCTRCKIPNHSKRDCWYRDKQEKNDANFVKDSQEDQLFYTCMSAEHETQDTWFLDSGCSSHMTMNSKSFVELDRSYSSVVKLEDGKLKKVEGKGIVYVNTNGEAFTFFLQFKALVERQSGYQMKTLRTDRGGEFIYKPFLQYCKENGIQRQLTVRRTPQQNGVAERKNPTIEEMARSYSDESKGFRLLNPKSNKLVVSRDVIFDEMESWQWEDNLQESRNFEVPTLDFQDKSNSLPNPNSVEVPRTASSLNRSPNTALPSSDSNDAESPPRKVRSLSDIYQSCEFALFSSEPQTFEDAIEENVWANAMDEEIASIERNQTWELVDLPNGREVIGLKWIYKTKFKEDGSIQKHKARLVAKGYAQQPRVDFHETFAPVVRMETIRTVLALAAQMELQVFQLDVKSAFLNGDLEEEVYVEQPKGYVKKGKEDQVYWLRKALYGLKQAPRAWNSKIDSYFRQNGFHRSKCEPSLYVSSMMMVEDFKRAMMKEYEMIDLGLMKYFLACKPVSTPVSSKEKLQQNDAVEKADAKAYRNLVGSLIYLTNTRPDICSFCQPNIKIYESAQQASLCNSKKNSSLPTRHKEAWFKGNCLEFKEAKDSCFIFSRKLNTLQLMMLHVKLFG